MTKNYCIDCNKEIDKRSKRCVQCHLKTGDIHLTFGIKRPDLTLYNQTRNNKGKNNGNYKQGLPRCIDCDKKLSNYNSKRCIICEYASRKGKNNHNYKDGRTLKPKKYSKWLRKNSIQYKISVSVRSRISAVLKVRKINKDNNTVILLGCKIGKLKQHLEKQFVKGMNWDNYGRKGWHIDHIKSCCSFDLSQESEQMKCFHYTNLQPLWWYDNLRKRKKIK